MPQTELLKDLILDFQQQKSEVQAQIQLIDPVATSIRKPAANRLLNKSMLIVGEILMYCFFLAFLGLAFFSKHFPILNTWDALTQLTEVKDSFIENDLLWFEIIFKGSFFITALLFLWIGRMLSKFRHKNDVLQLAAQNMNTIVERLFKRKVELEQMEHQYDGILSVDAEGKVSHQGWADKHSDISFDSIEPTNNEEHKNEDDNPPLDPHHKDIIL